MNEDLKEIIQGQRRLEQGMAKIDQKLDTTHEWVKSHDDDIKSMQADLNKAKGGWFAVIGLTGIAGAIGGFLSTLIRK